MLLIGNVKVGRGALIILWAPNNPANYCRNIRLLGDSWANDVFPNDIPHPSIVSVCWGGNEPSMSFQSFGRVDCGLPISDGAGSVVGNISPADGVLGPALHQPIEQRLCVVGLFVFFLDWCRSSQPLKN